MTKIQKMRKRCNLTQLELATLSGKHRVSISKLERHGIKRVSTAKRYAEILGCDPLEIIEL